MKKELNGKKDNAVGQSDIKCLFLLHLCVLADVSPSLIRPSCVFSLCVFPSSQGFAL